MKTFTIYSDIGEILRTGMCQNSTFDIQAGDGEFIIEGYFDAERFRIIDGVAVELPERPGDNHVFDHQIGEWVKDSSEELAARSRAALLLSETDWYVTRMIETGKPIPLDISVKREEARKLLSK